MTLFVDDPDFRLYVGDVRDQLALLPDAAVDCVVTSPPYFGLRDYGTKGQIGLEATPQEYVQTMVAVFREIHRVLAPHGTAWVNLGDSYAANRSYQVRDNKHTDVGNTMAASVPDGLKSKDLMGIPWRVAFALQDDGWYLRSDVVWSKPNPMPESVVDRPTKSHEYVFLLTKAPSYYFDQEAVREPFTTLHAPGSAVRPTQHYGAENGGNGGLTGHLADVKARLRDAARPQAETLDGSEGEAPRGPDGRRQTGVQGREGSVQHRDGERWPNEGRNIRSVWTITTQPYSEAHFATFPEELPRRCILAGCPEWVCRTCGKPRQRLLERGESDYARLKGDRDWRDLQEAQAHRGSSGASCHTLTPGGVTPSLRPRTAETLGWSDCGHGDFRAGVVLDPFMGAGTTALVARKLARHSVGIELNPEYADLIARRLHQLSLFA